MTMRLEYVPMSANAPAESVQSYKRLKWRTSRGRAIVLDFDVVDTTAVYFYEVGREHFSGRLTGYLAFCGEKKDSYSCNGIRRPLSG